MLFWWLVLTQHDRHASAYMAAAGHSAAQLAPHAGFIAEGRFSSVAQSCKALSWTKQACLDETTAYLCKIMTCACKRKCGGGHLVRAEVALSSHAGGVHARHNRLEALRLALIMRIQLRGRKEHMPQLASLL